VRSCWDYHLAPVRFLAWLEGLRERGIRVANGVDAIARTLHKRYLLDLHHAHGVPIPPTVLVPRGDRPTLSELGAELGTNEFVVKPAISLSAFDTHRLHAEAPDAQRTLDALLAPHDMLVQAWLPEIAAGEYSLVFFDNAYSHAVMKTPATGDFRVQRDHGGTHRAIAPPAFVVDAARRVLDAMGASFDYARVDGVVVRHRFLLMELELIDPVLFFGLADEGARTRFADALLMVRAPGAATVPALR
jgi:glutathione synthase/RimK-type ligase-like ATP-grasp enzyme